jgi:tetratricopeptide (TPR) repeat protein
LTNESLSERLTSQFGHLASQVHQALEKLASNSDSIHVNDQDDSAVIQNLKEWKRSADDMVPSGTALPPLTWQQQSPILQWIPNHPAFPPITSPPSTIDTSNSDGFVFSPTTDSTGATSPRGWDDDKQSTLLGGEVIEGLPSPLLIPPVLEPFTPVIPDQPDPRVDPGTAVRLEAISASRPTPPSLSISILDPKPPSRGEDQSFNRLVNSASRKFSEGKYSDAEGLLDRTLKLSEEIYGLEFTGRDRILATLASACAYQGKTQKAIEILDKFGPSNDWKHLVLEVLVIGYLEEGRWNSVSETVLKYGTDFEGRDELLAKLVLACAKHGGWSAAATIVSRYPQFQGRDRVLEMCISECRRISKWNEAEKFLLELLPQTMESDVKGSKVHHVLAEVYLAKKDIQSARIHCQTAVHVREKIGDPLLQESVYLLAKIVYEANSDHLEFEGLRHRFPQKIQGTDAPSGITSINIRTP